MKIKTLNSIYLKNNHIKSLRHELCEIIYKDYKGTTFFLYQMIIQKERVIEDLKNFIKKHPEIYNFKENSSYYYPYENVNKDIEPYLYFDFYIDNKDNAVHFGKGNEISVYDYLLDPLKIQFSIMAKDISQMDINSDNAKKIVQLNYDIFKILLDVVGDTIDYQSINTFTYIEKYIESNEKVINDVNKDNAISVNYKHQLLTKNIRFKENLPYITDTLILLKKDQLENKIEINQKPTLKNKI